MMGEVKWPLLVTGTSGVPGADRFRLRRRAMPWNLQLVECETVGKQTLTTLANSRAASGDLLWPITDGPLAKLIATGKIYSRRAMINASDSTQAA